MRLFPLLYITITHYSLSITQLLIIPTPLNASVTRLHLTLTPLLGKRTLNTPLAAMLPKEHADVNVTDWFPEFRYEKVVSLTSIVCPSLCTNTHHQFTNLFYLLNCL